MQAATSLEGLITSARAWLDDQMAQTERLRPMLAAAAVIAVLGLLIGVISFSNESARNLRTTKTELGRLQQQVKDGSWGERKKQSETLRFQLYEQLWTGETAGLAEANYERWLRERIETENLRPDTIRIQRSPVTSTASDSSQTDAPLRNVQRMTAKVVMPYDPDALTKLLNAAASSEKIMVVDRLLIRSGRNPLIEMDISTFVTLPESAR